MQPYMQDLEHCGNGRASFKHTRNIIRSAELINPLWKEPKSKAEIPGWLSKGALLSATKSTQ